MHCSRLHLQKSVVYATKAGEEPGNVATSCHRRPALASLVPRPFCVSFPGRAGRAGGRETEGTKLGPSRVLELKVKKWSPSIPIYTLMQFRSN